MNKKISLLMVFLMILSSLIMIGCSIPSLPSNQSTNDFSPIRGNITKSTGTTQTITLQPGPNGGKNALLHGLSSLVNTNMGSNTQFCAAAWTFGSIAGNIRSVIAFDLSSIPGGSVINSANLSLYAWDSTGGLGQHSALSGSNACWLQRITSSWDENTVTWNTQPSTTPVNQIALPASTSSTQNYLNIDITAMVQDMINDPSVGYGIMLRLQNETYYRRMNFCSSDHPNSALRPTLVVTYTPSIIIKSGGYLTYPIITKLDDCVIGTTFATDITFTNASYDYAYWFLDVKMVSMTYNPDDIKTINYSPNTFTTGNGGSIGYNKSITIHMTGKVPLIACDKYTIYGRIRDLIDSNDLGYSFEVTGKAVNPIPDPPKNLAVSNITLTGCTLTWSNSKYADIYRIYDDSGLLLGTTAYPTTKYVINKNFAPGSTYTYYVSASNNQGDSAKSKTTFTIPLPPLAPVNLCATNISNTRFTLFWSASSGATVYKIYNPDGSMIGTTSSTSYMVIGNFTPESTYKYSVSATNISGESAHGIISVTIPLPTPKFTHTFSSLNVGASDAAVVSQTSGVSSYEWVITPSSGISFYPGGIGCGITARTLGSYILKVRALSSVSSLAVSDWASMSFSVNN